MNNRKRSTSGALALLLLIAAPGAFGQPCDISGPNSADINELFTLCGPTGNGYEYGWYGPGISGSNDNRCVTASVSRTGTNEYLLVLRRNGAELSRCRKTVNVGGSTGGGRSCAISGPNSIRYGETARLCGTDDGLHTFRWEGPEGFTATSACVTVRDEGTYFLTTRNKVTGGTRQCTHRLDVTGVPERECDISGPDVIPDGSTVRLCAPSRSNTSYQWTGPRNFTSTSRCITADDPGTYTLRLRDLGSGRVERCTKTLRPWGDDTGGENPDDVIYDNCPRDYLFWQSVFADRNGPARAGMTQREVRDMARMIDERSGYFNWADDVQGVREALTAGAPLTRRKQVARQYAALLANVVAGERGLTLENGDRIGLDPDTRVSHPGATTIRDLMAVTDRTLRTGRGSYARLNSTMNLVNRGRGIESTCE